MVIFVPMTRSDCVVNEKTVTDVVILVANRSAAPIVMLTLCTWPCAIARLVALDATSSEVDIVKPAAFELTADPVVNSPAANVMLLAPAISAAFAIVQTILRVASAIVHGDASAAVPPDGGTSTPTGASLAEK
jgi:hypothetical protein